MSGLTFLGKKECVELYAGVGAVATVAAELGLRSMDVRHQSHPRHHEISEDITTLEGFRTATTLVMRLTIGALLWLALVCASWVFIYVVKV